MIRDTDSSETTVRDAFERLLESEPPTRVDARAAIDASRRDSHHRLVVRAAVVAAAVATASAVLATTAHQAGTPSRATTGNAKAAGANHAFAFTAERGKVPLVNGGEPQSALDGQIMVFVSPSPGTMTREPCGDPEFAAGVTCTETHLAGDAILSVRGLVDYEGIQTYEISLTHADGSGVAAEAGNFTLPPMPQRVSSGAEKLRLTRPTVSRPSPTYDADQLAAVAEAVDAAARA
jgi:hypothetical protein